MCVASCFPTLHTLTMWNCTKCNMRGTWDFTCKIFYKSEAINILFHSILFYSIPWINLWDPKPHFSLVIPFSLLIHLKLALHGVTSHTISLDSICVYSLTVFVISTRCQQWAMDIHLNMSVSLVVAVIAAEVLSVLWYNDRSPWGRRQGERYFIAAILSDVGLAFLVQWICR